MRLVNMRRVNTSRVSMGPREHGPREHRAEQHRPQRERKSDHRPERRERRHEGRDGPHPWVSAITSRLSSPARRAKLVPWKICPVISRTAPTTSRYSMSSSVLSSTGRRSTSGTTARNRPRFDFAKQDAVASWPVRTTSDHEGFSYRAIGPSMLAWISLAFSLPLEVVRLACRT